MPTDSIEPTIDPTAKDKLNEFQSQTSRIKEIKENIRAGEAWLKNGNGEEKDGRWKRWERNASWLRCEWNYSGMPDEEKTDFHDNIPFTNHQTTVPNLIFKNPKVNVEAKKPEFERDDLGEVMRDENNKAVLKSDNYAAARLMQVRINHEVEQIKLKDVVSRCVEHSDGINGIGWAKVGYQKLSVPRFNNDRNNKTNYWIEWVDPKNVLYDWRAVEAKHMRWVAHRIVEPVDDCRAKGFKLPENYVGKIPEHIEKIDKQAELHGSQGSHGGTQSHMVEYFEYHDLVQNTIDWVLIDGPGEDWFYMADTSENPYPFEGCSLKPLVITRDDGDLIGITSIKPIEETVLAINRAVTRQIHHIDNYGTGLFFEDGAINPKELKKYRKTPYGFEVKINDGYINKIKLQGTPSMGQDQYAMVDRLRENSRITLAITDYQQGGANVQRKATEAQIITSASSVRVEHKRQIVADFVVELIEALAAMIQEFDDEEDFYNVAGEEFDEDFVEMMKQEYGYNPKIPFLGISRHKIQGEFHYRFKIEDMIMQPKEVRAAQLARSIEPIMSNDRFLQKFEQKYDIDKVFEKMFELNGVDLKEFEKSGPVQLTAVMENQMFKKSMEVPEPHEKDDHDEHIIAHGPLIRELEQSLMMYQQKIEKLKTGLMMVPEMMAGDQMGMQKVQQRTQEQMSFLIESIKPIEMILRRAKLHVQMHNQRIVDQGLVDEGGMGSFGGPQTGRPTAPPSQVMMNQPAQPSFGGTFV